MDFLDALDGGDLVAATKESIRSARDAGRVDDQDLAACVAILELAAKIQVMDDYFDALMEDAIENKRRPPSQDNVSLPTYLKYCESLGLTPAGRSKAVATPGSRKPTAKSDEPKGADDVERPSNVSQLRGPLAG